MNEEQIKKVIIHNMQGYATKIGANTMKLMSEFGIEMFRKGYDACLKSQEEDQFDEEHFT